MERRHQTSRPARARPVREMSRRWHATLHAGRGDEQPQQTPERWVLGCVCIHPAVSERASNTGREGNEMGPDPTTTPTDHVGLRGVDKRRCCDARNPALNRAAKNTLATSVGEWRWIDGAAWLSKSHSRPSVRAPIDPDEQERDKVVPGLPIRNRMNRGGPLTLVDQRCIMG